MHTVHVFLDTVTIKKKDIINMKAKYVPGLGSFTAMYVCLHVVVNSCMILQSDKP